MRVSRRNFIAAAGAVAGCSEVARTGPAHRGRIRHSVAGWCFMRYGEKWSIEKLAEAASQTGCEAVELVGPDAWPTLKKYNLICAATPSHTFVRGMNNPKHWDECLQKLRAAIEATSAAGFPNVMTFTGFADTTKEGGSIVGPEEGLKNCVDAYKKIVGLAEASRVTLVLEPLNSRVSEPMKGHPGYQGDHVDYCVEIIKKVGSPGLKLLFDVYHAQIMDGDLVARIRQHGKLIGHVQTAGNPGRGELDERQEIFYPAVMRAFVEAGYTGFVGHEFIPTGDPARGLADAVARCTV